VFLAFLLLANWAKQSTGVVELPKGSIAVSAEIRLPDGAHDLELRGSQTTLRAADNFQGRAILSCTHCRNLKIIGLTFEGNRDRIAKPAGLPPSDRSFAQFTMSNGILIEQADGLAITGANFQHIAGFAVLVSASAHIVIEKLTVNASGSLNDKSRNNTTGGILMEEGTTDFTVRQCALTDIRGNGIWTHSLYRSPRNQDGRITENTFREIGRDAIQIGHATRISVGNNKGSHIGYPVEIIDVENRATPVAIDTAGNVDSSLYANNTFEEIDGKCIDLDGFHDGSVNHNTCTNREPAETYPWGHFAIVMNNTNPDMQSRNITITGNMISGTKFGGIFVIGEGNTIARNHMVNLNRAHCNETHAKFGCLSFADEPDILRSGIYLGRRAERPALARHNTITDNQVEGFGMKEHCIGFAPGVKPEEQKISGNACKE
jgi:parallel beta-helix repeat protein